MAPNKKPNRPNNNNRPNNSNQNRPSSSNNNRPPVTPPKPNNPNNNNNSNNNQPSGGGGGGNNNNVSRPQVNYRPSNNSNSGREQNNSKRNREKEKTSSAITEQRNAKAEEWRSNPLYTKEIQDALSGQVNKGLAVGQEFYDSPEFAAIRGDLTNQQIAEFAKSQGYKLGNQWQKDYGTGTNPAQTLKDLMNGDNQAKLHALLKIAAGQGKGTDLVSKKEFNKIYNYYDGNKTGLKITNRMDAINSKQQTKPVNNRYNPMGLQSDVFGRINKGKYGDNMSWAQDMGVRTFGKEGMAKLGINGKYKGPLSQLALNYKGSNLEGVKGMGVYGADAHGNAIFSPGQGGKSWSEHKTNNPSDYAPWYEVPTTTTPETPATETPKEATTPVEGFATGGIGDGGEKNALTFRQNRSRWKQDGRAYRGTSGLRFNRLSGFGGFNNAAAAVTASVF